MTKKSVPPSISEVAFDCPHCGAYTSQSWFAFHATPLSSEQRTPPAPDPTAVDEITSNHDIPQATKDMLIEYFNELNSGLIFLEVNKNGKYVNLDIHNLHTSQCFVCRKFSLWVHNSLVFPATRSGPPPNPDLPSDVLRDFEEASTIVSLSPRGAAALLRLAIQKLCIVLGEKGKKVDDDIASLVKKGLAPMTQKALDAVRVIGNEAVHPGTLDLKDDPDTANSLFKLVNVIAEQMISNPKHVDDIYALIPEEKRKAIEKRDGKPSENSAK